MPFITSLSRGVEYHGPNEHELFVLLCRNGFSTYYGKRVGVYVEGRHGAELIIAFCKRWGYE